MLDLTHANKRKQGDVGVGLAIGWFSSNGYTVCVPISESQRYDLIVEKDDRLYRVQVKTSRHLQRGSYKVHLRTNGGNRSGTGKTQFFDTSKCEFLFVVTANGDMYCIPTTEITCKTSITVSKYQDFRVHGRAFIGEISAL